MLRSLNVQSRAIVMAFYSVPKIILFPVFILFFGLGVKARIAMAFSFSVFPIAIATLVGVKDLNPVYVKLAQVMRAGPVRTVTKIYIPAVAPGLATASRMGFSLSIVGVVLSELFASQQGLGYLVMRAYGVYQLDRMFAIILFLFLLAVVFNVLFWGVEKWLRGGR